MIISGGGIEFDSDNPYSVAENGNREVQYASKDAMIAAILRKYPPEDVEDISATGAVGSFGVQEQIEATNNDSRVITHKPLKYMNSKNNGSAMHSISPRSRE